MTQKQIRSQLLLKYVNLLPEQMLPLPENPYLYFNMNVPVTIMIPLVKLHNIRARPEGIKNALVFMYAHSLGQNILLDKRDPISVKPMENSDYEIIDGNSTFNIAQQSGWQTIPAVIINKE